MLLTLLFFRIIWGFIGSTTARFGHFVAMPQAAINYLRALGKSNQPLYAGHNPAGGWMVLALITLLGLQITTGLFANDDVRFNGPLATLISKHWSDQLTALHDTLFNVILLFVWMHVVAVFFYLCVKNDNLIWPMVIGKKLRKHVPLSANLNFANPLIALLIFALSAGLVWWLFLRNGYGLI